MKRLCRHAPRHAPAPPASWASFATVSELGFVGLTKAAILVFGGISSLRSSIDFPQGLPRPKPSESSLQTPLNSGTNRHLENRSFNNLPGSGLPFTGKTLDVAAQLVVQMYAHRQNSFVTAF
jgi:hypothetical protein